jgi:pre-mRNA-splicing factor SPF27
VKHKTNASKWEESVANAKSQLEHTALRMQNLELMQKYAANAWRKHLEELEEVVKEYEGLVRKVDDQLEMVNSKRRLSQEEAQGHLRELNDEWISMTRKCALIEEKLRQMEKDEEIGMQ